MRPNVPTEQILRFKMRNKTEENFGGQIQDAREDLAVKSQTQLNLTAEQSKHKCLIKAYSEAGRGENSLVQDELFRH